MLACCAVRADRHHHEYARINRVLLLLHTPNTGSIVNSYLLYEQPTYLVSERKLLGILTSKCFTGGMTFLSTNIKTLKDDNVPAGCFRVATLQS